MSELPEWRKHLKNAKHVIENRETARLTHCQQIEDSERQKEGDQLLVLLGYLLVPAELLPSPKQNRAVLDNYLFYMTHYQDQEIIIRDSRLIVVLNIEHRVVPHIGIVMPICVDNYDQRGSMFDGPSPYIDFMPLQASLHDVLTEIDAAAEAYMTDMPTQEPTVTFNDKSVQQTLGKIARNLIKKED